MCYFKHKVPRNCYHSTDLVCESVRFSLAQWSGQMRSRGIRIDQKFGDMSRHLPVTSSSENRCDWKTAQKSVDTYQNCELARQFSHQMGQLHGNQLKQGPSKQKQIISKLFLPWESVSKLFFRCETEASIPSSTHWVHPSADRHLSFTRRDPFWTKNYLCFQAHNLLLTV